eukprot:358344-Chlamydomonas_euryale.AAC.8
MTRRPCKCDVPLAEQVTLSCATQRASGHASSRPNPGSTGRNMNIRACFYNQAVCLVMLNALLY